MKAKLLFISIVTATLMWQSCSENPSSEEHAATAIGEEKFNSYCGSCHNISGTLAPPPFAIQRHYKMKSSELGLFSQKIAEFVTDPSKQSALLSPAVQKFGIMPALSYPKEELFEIAQYLFEAEFEKPQHNKTDAENEQKQKGAEIAKSTKQLLGLNLMHKLNEGSAIDALEFCSINAIALTDSLAKGRDLSIQRVSNKPRNPKNQASEGETKLILAYQKQLNLGQTPEPQIYESEGKTWFYAPIETNQMCLQCHGIANENIKPEVLTEIQKRYPNDQAIGYRENQVRGLMKVEIR